MDGRRRAWSVRALAETVRLPAAALAAARRHRERGNEAAALLRLTLIRLRSGAGDEGLARLGAARRLAEALGMAPLAARCAALAAGAPAAADR
jgi:hypothetical protein